MVKYLLLAVCIALVSGCPYWCEQDRWHHNSCHNCDVAPQCVGWCHSYVNPGAHITNPAGRENLRRQGCQSIGCKGCAQCITSAPTPAPTAPTLQPTPEPTSPTALPTPAPTVLCKGDQQTWQTVSGYGCAVFARLSNPRTSPNLVRSLQNMCFSERDRNDVTASAVCPECGYCSLYVPKKILPASGKIPMPERKQSPMSDTEEPANEEKLAGAVIPVFSEQSGRRKQ